MTVDSQTFAAADELARAAEAEQAEANSRADLAKRRALADSLGVPISIFGALRNQYVLFDGGNNVRATLCPSYKIAFSPQETPVTQAVGFLGGATFHARPIGVSGNGIGVTVAYPTDVPFIPPVTPPDEAFGSVRLYAVRNVDVDYVVEIVDGGFAGAATYRVSQDGGVSFAPKLTVPIDDPDNPLQVEAPFTFAFSNVKVITFEPPAVEPLMFAAGARFTFAVRRQFLITVTRGELRETWPPLDLKQLEGFELNQVEAFAQTGSFLISKVVAPDMSVGSTTLGGGAGGSVAALSARLKAATEFPDASSETVLRMRNAVYELTGDLSWHRPLGR